MIDIIVLMLHSILTLIDFLAANYDIIYFSSPCHFSLLERALKKIAATKIAVFRLSFINGRVTNHA